MEILIAAITLVLIAFAMLSITILVKKDGKFPNLHIGSNKGLKKRGIGCATSQDRIAQREAFSFKNFNKSILPEEEMEQRC